MKWNDVKTKGLPETLEVNYLTRMSHTYLVWTKNDDFTLAYVIQDALDHTWEWRNYDGVDITRLVTHWASRIEGPKDDS